MIKLLLAAVFALSSVPAYAFIFINGGGGFNKGGRPVSEAIVWPSRTVTFHINTDQSAYGGSISPELTAAEFRAAVESAVNAWAATCGSDVRVVLSGTTSVMRDANDSFNSISWDNRTTAGGNGIGDTGTLAVAYSSVVNSTDTSAGCDIVVNGEASGDFGISGEASKIDLVGVLVHEMGHCLGLDHSIEPPTFTSANSILLNASMKASVAAGDLTMRTISQDEIDAMECVNPSGGTARSGRYCTSYHGTSGGAALTGTVSGGPSAERTCGAGATTLSGLDKDGGGCITSAFGSVNDGQANRGGPEGFALWPLFVAIFLQLAWRFGRRSAWFLVLLSPTPAFAGAELWFGRTFTTPTVFNDGIKITSAEGTYTSVSPAETIQHFNDLGVSFLFASDPTTFYGPFFRYALSNTSTQKGLGTQELTKVTKVTGWTTGLQARFASAGAAGASSGEGSSQSFRLMVDFLVGIGPYEMNQTYAETASSELKATAIALEGSVLGGMGVKLMDGLSLNIRAGYTFLATNAFSVKTKSGSRYSSLREKQRLAVNGTQELKLNRSGANVLLGFEAIF